LGDTSEDIPAPEFSAGQNEEDPSEYVEIKDQAPKGTTLPSSIAAEWLSWFRLFTAPVYYSKVLSSSMSPGEMKLRFETIKYGITRNDSMKSWRDVVQGLLTDRKERTEIV